MCVDDGTAKHGGVRRSLGIAVDLENLREGTKPVLRLLKRLEPDNGVLHLVGGPWAQSLVGDRQIPRGWTVRRDVNDAAPEAADALIHELIAMWREEGRVAVVVSSDRGFDVSVVAHRRSGVPSFLAITGIPPRRVTDDAPMLVLSDDDAIDEAVEAIEASR